jgi:RNase H-fold protein (predicted Holliday junction resolvase)
VLGLPRNTNGTEGAQAATTRAWAMAVLLPLGIPFVYRDERYTSQDAEAGLDGQPAAGRAAASPAARSVADGPSMGGRQADPARLSSMPATRCAA